MIAHCLPLIRYVIPWSYKGPTEKGRQAAWLAGLPWSVHLPVLPPPPLPYNEIKLGIYPNVFLMYAHRWEIRIKVITTEWKITKLQGNSRSNLGNKVCYLSSGGGNEVHKYVGYVNIIYELGKVDWLCF